MKYASETSVSVEKSKAEIERLLQRYGASEFAHGWRSDKAIVQFSMSNRCVRFTLPLPNRSEFRTTPSRRIRSDADTLKAWEQGCRQRWRALTLTIKAKLESVESGIEEFDTAFMGQVVMPNGKTISEEITPMIEQALRQARCRASCSSIKPLRSAYLESKLSFSTYPWFCSSSGMTFGGSSVAIS
jgi:hypothetical protein